MWLKAYEQVVFDHEGKTQIILSLSMPSVGQVMETIAKNQNTIRSTMYIMQKIKEFLS